MSILLFALLLYQSATLQPPLDPQRLEAESAADADVLRSLSENGDVPNVVRPVDVVFVGSAASIASLERDIAALGWTVIERDTHGDGNAALHVQRRQTTDQAAIRQLTEAALRIETLYGVSYDGWGTVASAQ